MKRKEALILLGGSVRAAANATGLTTQAIYKWPKVLSDAQEGRVMLALSRIAKKQRLKSPP